MAKSEVQVWQTMQKKSSTKHCKKNNRPWTPQKPKNSLGMSTTFSSHMDAVPQRPLWSIVRICELSLISKSGSSECKRLPVYTFWLLSKAIPGHIYHRPTQKPLMLQILGLLAKRLPLSELQDDDPRLTQWLQVYQESPYKPKLVWSLDPPLMQCSSTYPKMIDRTTDFSWSQVSPRKIVDFYCSLQNTFKRLGQPCCLSKPLSLCASK